jgi:hypothetical protein
MKHVSNVYTRETLKELWESFWGEERERERERKELGDLILGTQRLNYSLTNQQTGIAIWLMGSIFLELQLVNKTCKKIKVLHYLHPTNLSYTIV